MSLEKFPRWALISVCGSLISLCLFFTYRAVADADTTKIVAYQARSTADNAYALAQELKTDFKDFRKDYKEDQKQLDVKLDALLRK